MKQLQLLPDDDIGEDPAFLSEQIITYIGNKRSLLPFIGKGIEHAKKKLKKDRIRSLDLFSGSGVVARYLKQHSEHVIANDLESYSRVSNQCYLANSSSLNLKKLQAKLGDIKSTISKELKAGFITELYSPQDEQNITAEDRCFYTRENAIFLDTAARVLQTLPAKERVFFLAPLLSEASVHANTSGVFKGFYKNDSGIGQFGGHGKDALKRILGKIELQLPVLSRYDSDFSVYQSDANELVDSLDEVDLAYFDPPYNQHPYGSNYFMLNLLVNYQRPQEISKVSGIPVDWNRSRYNQKKEVESALFSLVQRVKAKYVLISYNSEGFISHESFTNNLSKCGKVTVLETAYNTFRGSRNLRDRSLHVTEYLFLLAKN